MDIRILTLFLLAAGQWTRIGPGGGGAQFIPTISPHDSSTVLVRCDMTGAYLTRNGGKSWGMINLGGVRAFAFDPGDARTMYAVGIGLWRSSDGGVTWNLVYPAQSEVSAVERPDDHASDRIVTRDGRYIRIAAMAIDPKNAKRLYLAVDGSLLESADAGKSWRKGIDLPGGVLRLIVEDGTVAAVTANSILIGGKSFPTPAPFIDISRGGDRLYAISRESIHVSEDGGKTWRASPFPSNSQPRLAAIATSANHSSVAYVSYSNLDGRHFGVAKTTDAGRTWAPVWKEIGSSQAENVHDVWVSQRFGPGWGENPIGLGVAPTDPNLVYGTDLGRTMRSTDGGANWTGVYSRKTPDGFTTTGLDVTTSYGVHFDPFNAKRQFISYTDIGLFRSEDGGKSWLSSTTGVPRPWVNTTYWVEFDPAVEGRMWAAMSGTHDLPRPKMWRRTAVSRYSGGVAISDDGGRTWRQASKTLPPSAVTHILLDPKSKALYITAFGRGVFKSTDGGANWELKNNGIEGAEPFAWRLARDSSGTLYLVVARRSEDSSSGTPNDGALYRSTDGAEHWQRIALPEGLNGPNGLAIDPTSTDRIYLAAWGRAAGKTARDGGIFLSTDAGRHWRNVLSKDQHVYDVTIDPRNPAVLYACGFESSAWRSADRGETWNRIAGYDFKWGHRVIPDPASPGDIYVTTFGGSVWHGPASATAPHALTGPVRWNPPPIAEP